MSNRIEDYTDEELVLHYRDMQHLSVDASTKEGLDYLRYYQRLVREMARRFAILIENMETPDETQGKTKQGDYWPGWKIMGLELPEVGKDVLICDIDGSIYLTHRVNITKTEFAFYDVWGDKIKNIVAWMPLPKPYQEEAADDREQ